MRYRTHCTFRKLYLSSESVHTDADIDASDHPIALAQSLSLSHSLSSPSPGEGGCTNRLHPSECEK